MTFLRSSSLLDYWNNVPTQKFTSTSVSDTQKVYAMLHNQIIHAHKMRKWMYSEWVLLGVCSSKTFLLPSKGFDYLEQFVEKNLKKSNKTPCLIYFWRLRMEAANLLAEFDEKSVKVLLRCYETNGLHKEICLHIFCSKTTTFQSLPP